MSTALAADEATARIRLGWVVRKTFLVVAQRGAALSLLAFGLIFLPQLLVSFLPRGTSGISIVAGLPGLIFGGAAALITYRQLEGPDSISGMDALRAGTKQFGALWLVGLLSGLAELGGLLLLIVPGLVLIIGWMPATAVVMVEGLGSTKALARAWALTRGDRWAIAALFAIFLVGSAAAILLPTFAGVFLAAMMNHQTAMNDRVLDLLSAAFVSVVNLVGGVGATTIYVALREAKEGPPTTIASVFD
jgi:hypothetical protein